jgi:hypothetical protein
MMQAVYQLLLSYAPRIEASMKENRPWTDRTSNARQGLASFAVIDGEIVILYAKTQVEYGKWLELAKQGRYAIVLPTLEEYYADIWADVEALVR